MDIISFESIDGAGKTTQIKKLVNYLKQVTDRPVVLFKEPSGSLLTSTIIKEILSGKKISPVTEMLAFLLDRSYNIDNTISKLPENTIVVFDRYVDSTLVYQCHMKNISRKLVSELHDIITHQGMFLPTVTVLLDIEPAVASERLKNRTGNDYFDNQDIKFYEKLREGYLYIYNLYPNRISVVDAGKSVEEVFENIRYIVDNKITY